MKLSFRWYGEDDKVTLQNIRQIPGMEPGEHCCLKETDGRCRPSL